MRVDGGRTVRDRCGRDEEIGGHMRSRTGRARTGAGERVGGVTPETGARLGGTVGGTTEVARTGAGGTGVAARVGNSGVRQTRGSGEGDGLAWDKGRGADDGAGAMGGRGTVGQCHSSKGPARTPGMREPRKEPL